jgi:hypothetical protein
LEQHFKIAYHHVIHILAPYTQSWYQSTLHNYGIKKVSLTNIRINKSLDLWRVY